MKKVDFICPAPFVSNVQWAFGSVKMCCNDQGTDGQSLDEGWNSLDRMEARAKWLKGEVPKRCIRCVSGQLKQNGIELIGHYMAQFPDFKPDGCLPDGRMLNNPKYLHLSPHNTCQLACRMCSSGCSTSYGKMFGDGAKRIDNRAATIDYVKNVVSTVTHYVFHGGEPMNDDSFLDILDVLYPHKDKIRISVLSNGMSLKSRGKDVIEILRAFPNLEYMLSLDGTPEVNEHQRELSNTKRIVANYNRLASEIPHAEVRVNQTLTNLTIASMPEFYQFLNDSLVRLDGLNHGDVSFPVEYQVCNVPVVYREKILKKMLNTDTSSWSEALVQSFRKLTDRITDEFSKPFDSRIWGDFQAKERRFNAITPQTRNTLRLFTDSLIPTRNTE